MDRKYFYVKFHHLLIILHQYQRMNLIISCLAWYSADEALRVCNLEDIRKDYNLSFFYPYTQTYNVQQLQIIQLFYAIFLIMSAGFYLTSGFLYLNMAPQIVFVLISRMKAQGIQMDKIGSKILSDIILTMYKPAFVANIIKAQAPIYIPTFYEIFHKIVNSSSLKLDRTSMQKLFYLILMTLKKQLFLSSSPLELYTLTITHFKDLINTLSEDQNKQALNCLYQGLTVFQQFGKTLTYIQFHEIREQILSMLESYHSKIVLFTTIGLQNQHSGHLIHVLRNTHHNKSLGKSINHPDIQIPGIAAIISKKKNLDYQNYIKWPTDLGKDDYDDIRGSSKNAKTKTTTTIVNESKITNNYEIGDSDGSKSLSQVLKVNHSLQSFELKLDLFETNAQSDKGDMYSNLIKQNAKNTNQSKIIGADISGKIEKQFADLQIKEGLQKDEEVDLLDMMDS